MSLTIFVSTPAHCRDLSIASAAAAAGGVGLLHFANRRISSRDGRLLRSLHDFCGSDLQWGIRCDASSVPLDSLGGLFERLERPPPYLMYGCRSLNESDLQQLSQTIRALKQQSPGLRFFAEVVSVTDGQELEPIVDGLVLSGNEAGGFVSRHSSYIFLQHANRRFTKPYVARGGIGPDTAAAAVLAGASGVLLEEQCWLAAESRLPAAEKQLWRNLDATETECVDLGNCSLRLFARSGREKIERIKLASLQSESDGIASNRVNLAEQGLSYGSGHFAERLICLGQDIVTGRELADRFISVSGILRAFRRAIRINVTNARQQRALREGSELAVAWQTGVPIVQGPMTRVSDVTSFAKSVAEFGGLPFLALSLMRSPEIERLLQEAAESMSGRPWGVGILGFVPKELRAEQLTVVRRHKPSHVIIAGGRSQQALELERDGIATLLHVPSLDLLTAYVQDGCRRFVLEGRECGGHVGPRSSFVLWQSVVDRLLSMPIRDPESMQLIFAGGIHDALSAAMVSVIAAPLVSRGMRIGLLMGTAYLFTGEAASSGAITAEYQRQAIVGSETALLESGNGYVTRVLPTPFVDRFDRMRESLVRDGVDSKTIREMLEKENIGRLRIAAKGIRRDGKDSRTGFVNVPRDEQLEQGLFMIGDVATLNDRAKSIAELHRSVTEGALDIVASSRQETPGKRKRRRKEAAEPLAVVGLGCLFAGSNNIRQYWENIVAQFDPIREVPHQRWDPTDHCDPDRFRQDRFCSSMGSFLDDLIFDPTRYGIAPASVKSIEPIQLLALEVARQALEDADYQRPDFPRKRTAVIFAAAGVHELGMSYMFRTSLDRYMPRLQSVDPATQQKILAELKQQLPEWTEDSFAGFLLNVIPGRIANRFNLQGSNFAVDAACASSLAALQAGVEQLRNRSCDAVLVGAVDGTNNPFTFMSFAKTHALSPGRSRPLDENADGISLGEGLGAIVLKRLADAEAAGDRIYARITGVGSSSDGRHRSMTAPFADGQLVALKRAYRDAACSPDSVSLVELHCTGTQVGDRVELDALTRLMPKRENGKRCGLGTIKSMIGHTKTAAGMASLIKVILGLRQRLIPPTAHCRSPLTSIVDRESPFYVASRPRPWTISPRMRTRRAGVSSFGFGGTNFHVLVEEHRPRAVGSQPSTNDLLPRSVEVFCWARRDLAGLQFALQSMLDSLSAVDRGEVSLPQVAFSAYLDESRRKLSNAETPAHRLSIVAGTADELTAKLTECLHQFARTTEMELCELPGGAYCSSADPIGSDQICFLFPGQGSQSIDMMHSLALRYPIVHQILESADRQLQGKLPGSLGETIFPPPAMANAQRTLQEQALIRTEIAQPALAAMECFALDLLQRFGIRAGLFAGHSFGELVALHAAGAFGRKTLWRLAALRGAACAASQAQNPGAMAAVFADSSLVQSVLDEEHLDATVANVNAGNQTVVAGSMESIDRCIRLFSGRGLVATRLRAGAAFHSEAMQSARSVLEAGMTKMRIQTFNGKVFSNVAAMPMPNDPPAIRELLSRQLTSPVLFREQIENLYEHGARVFLEVGPGHVLSKLVANILGGLPHSAIPMDDSGTNECAQLGHLLGRMFVLGANVDLLHWFEHRGLIECSLAEHVSSAARSSQRKPTDWVLNTWRATPFQEADRRICMNPIDMTHQLESDSDSQSAGSSEPSEIQRRPQSIAQLVQAASARPHAPTAAAAEPAARNRSGAGNPWAVTDRVEEFPANGVCPAPARQENSDAAHWMMARLMAVQESHQQAQLQFLQLQRELLAKLEGLPMDRIIGTMSPVEPIPRVRSQEANHVAPALTSVRQKIADVPLISPVNPVPKSRPAVNAVADTASPTASVAAALNNSHSTKPPVEKFRNDLLAAISHRTGYPTDMLGEDMELEGGLGIDSIKMVEIFSALKEYHPFLPGADDQEDHLANFANQKTIRDILEFYWSIGERNTDSNALLTGLRHSGSGLERRVVELIPARLDEKKNGSLLVN